jgi:hypothetical protein
MRRGWARLGRKVLTWGAALAMLPLLACGGSAPPTRYPSEIVEAFVAACKTNAEESLCRCAIDRIQRKFSLDEYLAFENRIAHREVPKELADATAECRGR